MESIHVNSIGSRGDAPLHTAIKNRYFELINQLLARNDVDVNLRNHDGYTPLALAVKYDLKEVAKKLLPLTTVALADLFAIRNANTVDNVAVKQEHSSSTSSST